ncbi:MAG TPA: hypothetical protein VGL72_13990 [Bryobacteraceae bacterium]
MSETDDHTQAVVALCGQRIPGRIITEIAPFSPFRLCRLCRMQWNRLVKEGKVSTQ